MYKRREIQRRAVIPPTRKTGTFHPKIITMPKATKQRADEAKIFATYGTLYIK